MALVTRDVVGGFNKAMRCHVGDLALDHLLPKFLLGLTGWFATNKRRLWVVCTSLIFASQDLLVLIVHREAALAFGTLDSLAFGHPSMFAWSGVVSQASECFLFLGACFITLLLPGFSGLIQEVLLVTQQVLDALYCLWCYAFVTLVLSPQIFFLFHRLQRQGHFSGRLGRVHHAIAE